MVILFFIHQILTYCISAYLFLYCIFTKIYFCFIIVCRAIATYSVNNKSPKRAKDKLKLVIVVGKNGNVHRHKINGIE